MISSSTSQTLVPPINPAGNMGDSGAAPGVPEEQKTRQLPAVLGTRDLTVLMLLIVLFIANTNGVQFGGTATFIYWTLGLLTFLVPCALVTQWLARCFPGQGAPYLWAARILGARWSFFAAFCAWLPGVLAVVSAIESGLIFVQYLAPGWLITPAEQGITIVLVLLIPTGIACLPLRWLRYILLVVAVLYVGVFMLLGAAGIWWLKSGHAAAVAFNSPSSWQLNNGNFAVYGLVILAFLGVDIPIFLGGEIRGGKAGVRRATSYVWWGTGIAFLAYVLGTFGIMVIVPPGQSGAIAANVQAIQIVFGSLTGNAAAVVLAGSQVALTIAYILMFSRLLVVVAQNGRLPGALAKINRHGVPALSIVVQAAAVALVTILSLVVVPSFFGTLIDSDDLALAIYNVMQAGTTVVWVCSIIQIFGLVLWFLYRRKRELQTSRVQRVLLIALSVIGTVASLVGIWATVSQSWLPSIIPNTRWAILVLGVTLVSLVVGLISSELPHMHALLGEQRRLNDREIALRGQLQSAYDEQAILVEQQQVLLAEVDRLYREQEQAAVTDAITGLPNHRAVMSRIDEEVSRCQRAEGSCAVLFVDLDHFKRVNDTWGHRAGDAILREVGSRLSGSIRQEDFVGRYGGEEFALVLTSTDLLTASQAAERLLVAVNAQPCFWETEDSVTPIPIVVTTSIGVAVYPLHGTTREGLIESADQGMYRAKHTGRNRVCVADVEVTSPVEVGSNDEAPLPELISYDGHTREVVGLKALTAAAAARDRGTNAHAHRIVQLAEATACKLQRPNDELHLIRLSALLHDIGKIGIPDAILHKPGPLTEDEWSVMRGHPQIGRQILEQLGGVFDYLATIIVAHHERWDGKGYPLGLTGEEIPMSARILSVVDSYDAMTSRRPYREPLSVTEARAELQRCAGSQYDPAVVEAFLAVLSEQDEGTMETLPHQAHAM